MGVSAVRHQAIIWANVDLDKSTHMASLGHNELTKKIPYSLKLSSTVKPPVKFQSNIDI